MYSGSHLGFDGGSIGQQAGSMAASFVAKTGATMAISSLTSGAAAGTMAFAIGSMAGPIGMIIGAVVSAIMAIFGGATPKKPVFGLTIVTPEGKKPAIGLLLGYLQKPMFDWNEQWGLGKAKGGKDAAIASIQMKLRVPPPGAIAITSGGLAEAVEAAKKLNFNAISGKTAMIAAPFAEVLSKVTDSTIRAQLLAYELPFEKSSSYYFNLDLQNNPKAVALKPEFDQYKLSGGQTLDKALDKGFAKIASEINKAYIAIVGVDVAGGGTIVNSELATKAFQPTAAGAIAGLLPESMTGWLLLLGGFLLLRKAA